MCRCFMRFVLKSRYLTFYNQRKEVIEITAKSPLINVLTHASQMYHQLSLMLYCSG